MVTRGRVLTSTDGETWSLSYPPFSGFNDAAWNGSLLVALAGDNRLAVTSDGESWQDLGVVASDVLLSITWANDTFVAVGRGVVVTSSDGLTWTENEVPLSSLLWDVLWDGTLFVAVGNSGVLMLSTNGSGWVDTWPDVGSLQAGVAVNGRTYFTSASGVILSTSDYLHWRVHDTGTHASLSEILWTGEHLVAAGNDWDRPETRQGVVLISADGDSWTRFTVPGTIRSLLWTGEQLITAGAGRSLARASCIGTLIELELWQNLIGDGQRVPITVTLDRPASQDLVLSISSSDPAALQAPDSITIAAGMSQITFAVTGTAPTACVELTVALPVVAGGGTTSVQITVDEAGAGDPRRGRRVGG
jgi:hypothetical protein